jgi:hypothetical protein
MGLSLDVCAQGCPAGVEQHPNGHHARILTTARNDSAALTTDYTKTLGEPISVQKHFSPAFYTELWV